jgi:hypothetical protein
MRKLRKRRPVAAVYDRRSNEGEEMGRSKEGEEVRRSQTAATSFVRAGVVVPNGGLFGDRVCPRLRRNRGNWTADFTDFTD